MNAKSGTILIAAALAATAFNSRAQDVETLAPNVAPKALTLHQQQELDWLAAQITLGSTSNKPIPFPVPSQTGPAGSLHPVTAEQSPPSRWWKAEVRRDDGYGSGPSASN